MQESMGFTPQLTASSIAQILWLIPAVPIVASLDPVMGDADR